MTHKQLVIKEQADGVPEQQLVFAEVYAPGRPDSDGEFMSAQTIQKMAYTFIASGKMNQIDSHHDNILVEGCVVVESFIARKDDPDGFIEGSWVVGVHVDNDEMWRAIKAQEINGFSMESLVRYDEQSIEIEVPAVVAGRTAKAEDHEHEFYVSYDGETGKLTGGTTNMVMGHCHKISGGSVTDLADGHRHKFQYIEEFVIEGV